MSAAAAVAATFGARASLAATYTVTDLQIGSTSTTSFTIANTGLFSSVGNLSNPSGQWCYPPGGAAQFEVEFHVNSGTSPSGVTLDSWLACSSSRTASLASGAVAPDTKTCALRVRIRRTSAASHQTEAVVTMTSQNAS